MLPHWSPLKIEGLSSGIAKFLDRLIQKVTFNATHFKVIASALHWSVSAKQLLPFGNLVLPTTNEEKSPK